MFTEFKILRQWLHDTKYDLGLDSLLLPMKKRQEGYVFTKRDHMEALLLSILSANRPWIGIVEHLDDLKEIFHDYDPDFLRTASSDNLVRQITAVDCGNRRIVQQMQEIPYNIQILDRIEETCGSVDNPMQIASNPENTIDVLWVYSNPKSALKFKGVAVALAAQYMKNLGVDLVKPDVHLRRILERWGYTIGLPDEYTTIAICQSIAKECSITQTEVGTILWQFCATGYIQCCDAKPKCGDCPIATECFYNK